MWNTIVTILGLAAITNLAIESKPTAYIRETLYKKIYGCKGWIDRWHYQLVTCSLCLGFWVGLIVTTNLYYAAIISIISEFINRKLNS